MWTPRKHTCGAQFLHTGFFYALFGWRNWPATWGEGNPQAADETVRVATHITAIQLSDGSR